MLSQDLLKRRVRTTDIGDDVISSLEKKLAVILGKLYRRVVLGQS